MSGAGRHAACPAALWTLLQQAAADAGGTGATFVDRRERRTFHAYADLYAAASRLAESLAARGLRRGERVALVLPTGPSFYHALFATQALGAIAAPLYPPVRLGRLDEYLARTRAMLAQIDAALVVTTAPLAGLLAPALAAHRPHLGHVVLDGGLQAPAPAPTGPRAAARRAAPAFAPLPDLDDVALLQFSSGTTAAPKAVALTHRQVGANVSRIARALYAGAPPRRPDGRHRAVSWLPLYHDMGLMGCLLTALYDQSDVTLLAPETFVGRPASWLRAIAQAGASISAAPNFAYALCCSRIRDEELEGVDLSGWQVALNGAEGVSAETMRAFAARFARFGFDAKALTPVYGLAEAVLAVSFSAPGARFGARTFDAHALRSERRAVPLAGADADLAATPAGGITLVDVGRPLPDYAVRVVRGGAPPPADADARTPSRVADLAPGGGHGPAGGPPDVSRCAPGEVGELQVAGPSLMAGYWPLAAPAAPDRWLATGDLATVVDGALYIVGRQKDVVVVRGQNYAPDELERAIDDVPQVRRGCSIAGSVRLADAATDTVVLLVELRREAWPVADAEGAALRERLGACVAKACGLRVDCVELMAPGTLPRTSSGKKRRAEALRAWQAHALRPPAKVRRWRVWWRATAGRLALWRGSDARPQPRW